MVFFWGGGVLVVCWLVQGASVEGCLQEGNPRPRPDGVVLDTHTDSSGDFGDGDAMHKAPEHRHLHFDGDPGLQQRSACRASCVFLTPFPPASEGRRAAANLQLHIGLKHTEAQEQAKNPVKRGFIFFFCEVAVSLSISWGQTTTTRTTNSNNNNKQEHNNQEHQQHNHSTTTTTTTTTMTTTTTTSNSNKKNNQPQHEKQKEQQQQHTEESSTTNNQNKSTRSEQQNNHKNQKEGKATQLARKGQEDKEEEPAVQQEAKPRKRKPGVKTGELESGIQEGERAKTGQADRDQRKERQAKSLSLFFWGGGSFASSWSCFVFVFFFFFWSLFLFFF